MYLTYAKIVCQILFQDRCILDTSVPSLPTNEAAREAHFQNESTSRQTFPTDARIKQKERLKELKEKGEKPKKVQKTTEHGTDDCGDDLAGLGKDIEMFVLDTLTEEPEPEEEPAYIVNFEFPQQPTNTHGSFEGIMSYLCYHRH